MLGVTRTLRSRAIHHNFRKIAKYVSITNQNKNYIMYQGEGEIIKSTKQQHIPDTVLSTTSHTLTHITKIL